MQCKHGRGISADLELERVAVCPPAKVAVPDGALVDVLLSEGRRGCEASVVGSRALPALWWTVSWHGRQHHLTWIGKVELITCFLLVIY